MNANPITDQLAAGVAAKMTDSGPLDGYAEFLAQGLVEKLPDIEPMTIGEIALHVASALGALMIHTDKRHGNKPDQYVVNLLNVLAIGGHKLYTGGLVCKCGCLTGQPCGCGLEDCECIGDCSVCDAEERPAR